MSFYPALALLITFTVAFIALSNWRYGLLTVVIIGVLQDVFRKLTPDIPAYYVTWSMVIFGLVGVIAYSYRALAKPHLLWLGDQRLKMALQAYVLFILLHCIHSLLRFGSPVIPIFGFIFYLAPFAALLIVIKYANRDLWIRRFMYTYLWIMVPVCFSVYLSFWFKDDYPVLQEIGAFVGRELIIYDIGTVLYSYSGLLRVGEIAAFHAATSIAFLSILLLEKDKMVQVRIAYAILIALLIGVILLTGRRKMLMAISFFWVFQLFLLSVLRKGRSKQLFAILIIGVITSISVGMFSGESSNYLARGMSVFGDVEERVLTSFRLFQSALERSGWIGLGAGIASQGVRYAGISQGRHIGGSHESGIGYIAVELGLPGMLIIAWLIYNMIRVFRSRIRFVAKLDDQLLLYTVSFAALLLANFATFATATQLYGDFFVLITLGIVGGLMYASFYLAVDKAEMLLKYHEFRVAGKPQLEVVPNTP